jgi:hypothetical protein
MRSIIFALLCSAVMCAPASARTRVVILGVDHSLELVSRGFSAGAMSLFFDEVNAAAICIERPPEEALRGDFYEFTYEVQYVAVPYAKSHGKQLCPIDWMPRVEDQKLVFGADLDVPPPLRPQSGFCEFLTFTDEYSLNSGLFYYDEPAAVARVVQWAQTPAAQADQDFPRRLYLYRTFVQAEHIRAVARAYDGKTILVVIGYFHKPGLEAILKADPSIELVPASSYALPSERASDNAMSVPQRVAVLSFNLLGRQSATGKVDWQWMKELIDSLKRDDPSPEVRLFEIRYDELRGTLQGKALADAYESVANTTPESSRFSWDGVKDEYRVDSYFDPFGNVSIHQRAQLEYARVLFHTNQAQRATELVTSLASELNSLQASQLNYYVSQYIKG